MGLYKTKLAVLISFFVFFTHNFARGKSKLVELNEDNWHEMLSGEWMVEFFAPWCPACKALQPIWEDFSTWSDDLDISVGRVDVTTSPGLSGRFMVTALPTIFHIKNGVFRQYRGPRNKEELMNFIEEKKWEKVEVVPMWKDPGSYQMAVVAQFFKLSMVLRTIHTSFVEDYGFPVWASYLTFAVGTIVVGALLGLVMVCAIDFLFPPKGAIFEKANLHDIGNQNDDEDLSEESSKNGEMKSSEGQNGVKDKDGDETKSQDPDNSEVRQRTQAKEKAK